MSVKRYLSAFVLLLVVTPASSEWKPEYAQANPERQQWFQSQRINPDAQKRLNVPFKSCCDNGDVFKTRFRVGTANEDQWEYLDGDGYATLQLPGALHVNSAQTYEAAALAGLGLIQAPLMGIGRYLESGALVEIIPDLRRRALDVSLVVAHRRNLSRRVRAFMKWIEDVLTPYLE